VLSYFRRHEQSQRQLGLALTRDGIASAAVLRSGARPRLLDCAYEPVSNGEALARTAARLPRGHTVGVLANADYQLLLVEAPDVPTEELRAAVRWRIKDLIDFHVDDAVIDVFEMPAPSRGTTGRMMYAVVSRAELVRHQVDTIENTGLTLDAIDIPELCLRNVAALLEQEGAGVALLSLAEDYSTLLLVRGGVMYLTRRVETGAATLARAKGLRAELVAGLALEIRRSLDYFESHYEQQPVSAVYVNGLSEDDQCDLAADLAVAVQDINLASLLDCERDVDRDTLRRCLPAIGAALRHETVKL
jgi:MSHA biogenesis protein MshI